MSSESITTDSATLSVLSCLKLEFPSLRVTTILPLLTNNFVQDCLAAEELSTLSGLLGMDIYTSEDILKSVYGVSTVVTCGRYRLIRERVDIFSADDDALGTVAGTLAERARTKYPPCSRSNSIYAHGYNLHLGLQSMYEAFDRACFERRVLSYVKSQPHLTGYATEYDACVVDVSQLPAPRECEERDKYKWGLFFRNLSGLFRVWRSGNHMPPIPYDDKADRQTITLQEMVAGKHSPGDYGAPMDGKKFADWEKGMIANLIKEATIVEIDVGGETVERATTPAYFDPFNCIKSSFYRLPDLPELQPLEQEPAVGNVRETAPLVWAEEEPQPRCAPLSAGPVGHPEYEPARQAIRQYAIYGRGGIGQDRALRDSGKNGGPLKEGEAAFARISQRDRALFPKAIPSALTSLPEIVSLISRDNRFRKLSSVEIAALVANKCIMGVSQFPAEERKGEIYISNVG